MATLFSRKHFAEFLHRITHERWAFIFDFDGTLAPIHADPHSVKMTSDIRKSIRKLWKREAVFVITGRAVKHIVRKLPRGLPIIGEHGAASNLKNYELAGY